MGSSQRTLVGEGSLSCLKYLEIRSSAALLREVFPGDLSGGPSVPFAQPELSFCSRLSSGFFPLKMNADNAGCVCVCVFLLLGTAPPPCCKVVCESSGNFSFPASGLCGNVGFSLSLRIHSFVPSVTTLFLASGGQRPGSCRDLREAPRKKMDAGSLQKKSPDRLGQRSLLGGPPSGPLVQMPASCGPSLAAGSLLLTSASYSKVSWF